MDADVLHEAVASGSEGHMTLGKTLADANGRRMEEAKRDSSRRWLRENGAVVARGRQRTVPETIMRQVRGNDAE